MIYENRNIKYRGSHGTVTSWSGTSMIASGSGLRYVSFEETLPKLRTHKAEVYGGSDVDFTDNLAYSYENGTHIVKLLLYKDTEASRVAALKSFIGTFQGLRTDYRLSWEDVTSSSDYYCGRMSVDVQHLTPLADLLTVTIDREPSMYTIG